MRKKIFLLISIIFIFISLFSFTIRANSNVNANEFYVIGVKVRTSGNAGIRFVSDVSNIDKTNICKYGMLIAYGECNANDDFVLNATINGKLVLSGEVNSLDKNDNYFLTLYDIPQSEYNTKISARAYLIMNDLSVVYSEIIVTRSLKDVVDLAYINNNTSEFVINVYNYFKISEINLTINFAEHYLEKEENKFNYTYSNPTYDIVTIVITLKDDFEFINSIILTINNKVITANNYKIENNVLTCIIDDPYWTGIY